MPQMQNRVQETTTTGGTGTLTLAGAVTGYITFASGFSTGTSLFYTIDNGVGEWEIGIGTLVTTGTLSRVTVIASSNGGALVNFGSGTKRVFCSAPTRSLVPDQDSKSGYVLTTDGTDPAWTQTLNGITIGNLTAAGGAFTTLSASSTVSGSGFSTYLASPPAIGGTTPAAGAFTTLSASSTVSGTGFSTYLASPPAIGGTAAAAGAFTTLSASSTVSGTGFSTYLASPPAIGGTVAAAGAFTTLSASSTVSGSGFSTYLASPPAIGGTAPAAGKFTTLEATGNTTLGDASGDTVAIQAGTAALPTLIPNGDPNTGLWFPAADTIAASTAGTERLRLDSSGNLGLGVTPSAWAGGYRAIELGGSGANYIALNSTSRYGFIYCNAYFNGSNTIYKNNGLAAAYGQVDGVHQWSTAASGTAGGTLNFGDPKMTLTAAGDLLVGTTGVGNQNMDSFSFSKGGGFIAVNHVTGKGSGSGYVSFGYGGGEIGSITQNGTTNVLYNTSSDYRLKKNVQPIQNALSRLSQLKPSTYQWNADGSDGEGFIAHELQEVVPQAVSGEKDGEQMQGVDYGKLTPLLAAAIQELAAEIESLKQRIA